MNRLIHVQGLVLVLVWVVINALKDVYLGHLAQGINTILLLLATGLLTTLFFNALQIPSRAAYAATIRKNRGDVLLMNLCTLAAWGGGFFSLQFLEPAVVQAFVYGMDPLATVVLTWMVVRRNDADLGAAIAMFATAVYLGVVVWRGQSGVGALEFGDGVMGLSAMTISAIGNGGIAVVGKRLANAGVPATQVTATRFLLVIVAGTGFVIARQPSLEPMLTSIGGVLAIALAGGIAPTFILQKALEKTEPSTVLLFGNILPMATYGLQLFDHRITFSWPTFGGVAAMCLIALWSARNRLRS